ncbi:MAG: hypothetical protein R3224_04065 [Balneolaceae bacterium]|nr:hypothetical protein [Balneolaceae bacterium]
MYVLDYHKQIALMQEMTQLRKKEEQWEVYYHHPTTNEMWKSYFPRANGVKRGPKILRTEPVPDNLEERIHPCLTSEFRDDAAGLGIELSVNPDKWDELLDIIENNYRDYKRSQLTHFFKHLCLFNYQELFEELHASPEQFGLDESALKQMKWRGRKILFKKFWIFW